MTFQDVVSMIYLIIAISGIFGSLAIAIVTDHMTKKQEELRKKTKKKRVVHRPDNERIKILLSEENIIEKINTIIDSIIANAANNYLILTVQDDQREGYISPDIEKEMSEYIFLTVKNNMTKDMKDLISMIYITENGELDKDLVLGMPIIKQTNPLNKLYNEDINHLVKKISADIVYLDPPYNSRQYCDAYHLLENIAQWKKPEVYGVAKKMNRNSLKSDYCTINAVNAFEDLIRNINAEYIVLSYNNMAEKGNERSNAKLSDDDIYRILNFKGKVKTFEREYKAFSTGKSNIEENAERLFICKCC